MNPALFRWARETAGLSLEQAAAALALRGVDKLQAIEGGHEAPSRPLLLRMSKQYRRPLIAFYLPQPPRKGDRGEDFRTLPPNRTVADDALLDAMLRDVKGRQAVVRALTEEEDDALRLGFIGSRSMNEGAAAVRDAIAVDLAIDTQQFRSRRTPGEAFQYLRGQAEAAGIYVLLIGSLGSHHSAISVKTFRGLAIADPYAPFIVINDQDAKTAWSFSLLHELTHLWLGASGVSGSHGEQAIERFCNEVASGILLRHDELDDLAVDDTTPVKWAIEAMSHFASRRHVSRSMVSYALLRAGRISQRTWSQLDVALEDMWQRLEAERKRQERASDSGPSYYVVRRHRLGRALLDFVGRSVEAGTLTPAKAAKILGVKPRSVYPLLAPIPEARG